MSIVARLGIVVLFAWLGALAGCVSEDSSADADACPEGRYDCDGRCVDRETDNANCGRCGLRCFDGDHCVGAQCRACLSGRADCDGDPLTGCEALLADDPRNCGACGNVCAVGRCTEGACLDEPCDATQTRCGDLCADLSRDRENCGACGHACSGDERCEGGVCGCPVGNVLCEGACVDLRSSRFHCGACRHGCVGDQRCDGGVCACPPERVECEGACVDLASNAFHCGACGHACGEGQRCSLGACVCINGGSVCGGVCVSLQSSAAHCGACGRACGPDEHCAFGACLPDCRGTTLCGDRCADVNTDAEHCGECGHRCAASQECVAGHCRISSCAAGTGDCDSDVANGCETSISTSVENCGACGRACAWGATCTGGVCACPAGLAECGRSPSYCANLLGDRSDCGGCGRACHGQLECVAGRCVCPPGQTNCGEYCADLQTGSLNCGGCGVRCHDSDRCIRGVCRCPDGYTSCPATPGRLDTCLDLRSNTFACGDCDRACRSDQVCADGRCTCAEGMAECAGRCVDVAWATTRCGACDVVCPSDRTCTVGRCACPVGTVDCGGTCVSTATSVANCGRCGNACSAPAGYVAACREGVCASACRDGFGDCDGDTRNGCETDVRTSASNCGRCGRACSGGDACVGGACPRDRRAFVFGGANEDAVDDVAVDAEGNVYVAGHVGGPSATIGTSTLTPTAGGAAAFLLVLSGEGAMRWVRRVGDGVYDHACGVVVGTGGDVFVLVNETITSGAGAVALLASFSPTGTLRWSRSLPGASCGSPSGLTLDAEGNLHVALRAGRSIDVGAGPVAVAHDTLTASFTRDGAFRSMIQFVDDNDLYLEASLSEIAFGSSGDGYAVGSFNGRLTAGAFSRTSAGGVDGFVAGVTSTGSVRWLRTLGGSGAENVWSVAVDASGDALITGALSGGRVMWGAEEFAPSVTRRGVFVARLASDGALRWSRRYPSTYAMALLRGASFNAAGEARFSGYFDHGMDFGFGPIATSKGAFVLRFGPSGDQRALRVIELPDELYNPVVRAREDAIVLGASFGHGVSTAPTSTVEGLTFRSVGPSDSVLLRLAP